MFIALVVAAVASLRAPLITSVATTFHVSLGSAQWTLTIVVPWARELSRGCSLTSAVP